MTRVRWVTLALALLAAGVYANAPSNGWALDDRFIIEHNQRVHGLDHLQDALTEPYWPGAPGRIGLFRPLTAATYALEWELWGDDPAPFHVTNVLLHALATVLVFGVLLTLLGRRPPGVAAAVAGSAVFAVHPVHVEAVANVVGRAELLAATSVLAACLLYLRIGSNASPRRLWWGAVGVAAAYFLGLASKEIAVTLPALLLVLEAGRGSGGRGSSERTRDELDSRPSYAGRLKARWPVYGGLVLALATYLMARVAVLGTLVGNDVAGFLRPLSGVQRLMTAVSVWPEYVRLMLFPVELVADYSPGVLMPVEEPGPEVLAGVAVAVLGAAVATYAWRRQRAVALGIAVFAVAVFPVSNLVVSVGVLLAERTLYMPSVGLALSVAGVGYWIAEEWPAWRRGAVVMLLVALALGAARTWIRTPTWRSTESVMATLAADHPESFRVQWLLADRLHAAGHVDAALERFSRVVELAPSHYQLRIHYGRLLLEAGHAERAADNFRAARRAVPDLPEGHVFLMMALLEAGRPDQATRAGEGALRHLPDHRGIHHQLAVAYARAGELERALQARDRSIRLGGVRAAPDQFVHKAELLVRLHRPEEAARALEIARSRARADASIPTLTRLEAAIEAANSAVLPYR